MSAIQTPTTTTPPSAPTAPAAPKPTASAGVILEGVSWETYVRLRDEADTRKRFTYAHGKLEIMPTSVFHEIIATLIDRFIYEWAFYRRIRISTTRTTTFQREDIEHGFEADLSYYIQHAAQMQGRREIDLPEDPPPDLAVEVDHTSSSLPKRPIYAAMGVPEMWRWHEETLTVYHLQDGEYQEQPQSERLPEFPLDQLRQALLQRETVDEITLLAQFRQWLSEHFPSN